MVVCCSHTHTHNPAIIVRVQVAAATTVTTGTERVPHTHEGESVARRVNDKFANATYKCETEAAYAFALERQPLTLHLFALLQTPPPLPPRADQRGLPHVRKHLTLISIGVDHQSVMMKDV
jgi:hypothetical protein